MLSYHLWGVASGETSVEGQDHDVYRNLAKSRGEVRVLLFRLHYLRPICSLRRHL